MITKVIAADVLAAPIGDTSARPFKLRCMDGKTYYVKLPLADQPRLLTNETIAAFLAAHVGLPSPPFALVEVTAELSQLRPEKDLPPGTYFGSQVLNGAFDFRQGGPLSAARLVKIVNAAKLTGVVTFDNWVVNGDRNNAGNNLLRFVDQEGKRAEYMMLDFGHCFCGPAWTREILQSQQASDEPVPVFPFLRAEIERGRYSYDDDLKWLAAVDTRILQKLATALPNSWGPSDSDRARMIAFLDKRKQMVRGMIDAQRLPGQPGGT